MADPGPIQPATMTAEQWYAADIEARRLAREQEAARQVLQARQIAASEAHGAAQAATAEAMREAAAAQRLAVEALGVPAPVSPESVAMHDRQTAAIQSLADAVRAIQVPAGSPTTGVPVEVVVSLISALASALRGAP